MDRPCQRCIKKQRQHMCVDRPDTTQQYRQVAALLPPKRKYTKRKTTIEDCLMACNKPRLLDTIVDKLARLRYQFSEALFQVGREIPFESPFLLRDLLCHKPLAWKMFQGFSNFLLGKNRAKIVADEVFRAAEFASFGDDRLLKMISNMKTSETESFQDTVVELLPPSVEDQFSFSQRDTERVKQAFMVDDINSSDIGIVKLEYNYQVPGKVLFQVSVNRVMETFLGRPLTEIFCDLEAFREIPELSPPISCLIFNPTSFLNLGRSWMKSGLHEGCDVMSETIYLQSYCDSIPEPLACSTVFLEEFDPILKVRIAGARFFQPANSMPEWSG
jgi:hypothetical protein